MPVRHARFLPGVVSLAASLLVAGMAASPAASAAEPAAAAPLISGLGKFAQVENAGERPDPALDYKVVLAARKAGEAGQPLPLFEGAARLANLLAASGVPADHRHLVVVVSGPATPAVLNEAGRKAHGLAPDANADAIAKLTAADVSVHVCGQALAAWKIARSELLPGVQVDLSALTTVTTLQLQGYAVVQD